VVCVYYNIHLCMQLARIYAYYNIHENNIQYYIVLYSPTLLYYNCSAIVSGVIINVSDGFIRVVLSLLFLEMGSEPKIGLLSLLTGVVSEKCLRKLDRRPYYDAFSYLNISFYSYSPTLHTVFVRTIYPHWVNSYNVYNTI